MNQRNFAKILIWIMRETYIFLHSTCYQQKEREKEKMVLERNWEFWENDWNYFPRPKKGPSTADLPSGTQMPKFGPCWRRVYPSAQLSQEVPVYPAGHAHFSTQVARWFPGRTVSISPVPYSISTLRRLVSIMFLS